MKLDLSTASVSEMLVALPLIRHRLAQLGLWRTAKVQDEAVHTIGYEVADIASKEPSA